MSRINHYLKRNHNSEMPSNILIVDTEARIEKRKDGSQWQTFRLGYAIHLMRKDNAWVETGYSLRCVDDFWELLDRFCYSKSHLSVFAHNMAYDYAILKIDSYLSSRKLEIKMRVIDSVFIVKAGPLSFISSTNFYRQSLKELGSIFGLSKMDSPDFETCSDDELFPYCKRDTEVLSKIIKQHIAFIHNNDLGSFKPTIAGQAFTAFRHRFMSADLLVHNYTDILEMEKESYRGGRCEAFRIGKFEDITALDINSMYPFVMRNRVYPTAIISSVIRKDAPLKTISRALKEDSFVIAQCYMNLKRPVVAVKRDKLLFPIGKVRQTITSPEIDYILSNPDSGRIIKFEKAVFYKTATIFQSYVDFFYDIRQKSTNEAMKAQAKVLLNSLYGKLGQRNNTTPKLVLDSNTRKMILSVMRDENTSEVFTGMSSKYVKLGDDLYYIEKSSGEFARDSIPSIASAVTSYARTLLQNLIDIADSDNVIYCDTDSLFVNREGLSRLRHMIDAKELGKLKIEKSGSCEIRGAKDYVFNGKSKLKGIKANAELLPDGRFRQFHFQTKNSRYRNGTPDGIVIAEPIIKSVSREYKKGIVHDDGSVSALMFDDEVATLSEKYA